MVSLVNHKAPVHHSLLEILTIPPGVAYEPALANMAQTFIVIITMQWYRWVFVGAVFHAILWAVTGDDPNRLYKLWRYCSYASYYRPG